MIPPFNEHGWLPDGIHDCTMDEAGERFGAFQNTDRRPQLWATFADYIGEAKACGLVEVVLVDGSFVTATSEPNDIDNVGGGPIRRFFERPSARALQFASPA